MEYREITETIIKDFQKRFTTNIRLEEGIPFSIDIEDADNRLLTAGNKRRW